MAIQATFGTTVSIDGAAIGEAISITPPQVKIATIQTTNLSSADSAHTFIAGFTDSGEVTIEANYEKAEYDAVVVAAVSMALGAAFLNAAFNFCLGCEIYLLLLRARSK